MIIKPLYVVFSNISLDTEKVEHKSYDDTTDEEDASEKEDSKKEKKEAEIVSIPLGFSLLKTSLKSIIYCEFLEGILPRVLPPPPDLS